MLKYTNLFIDADGHKHQHTIETNQIPTDILIQMTAEIMGLMPNQMDDDDEEDEYPTCDDCSTEEQIEKDFVKKLVDEDDAIHDLTKRIEHLESVAANRWLKAKEKP